MIRSAISTAIHESSYAANEHYKSQAALVVLHQGSDKAVTTSRATVSPLFADASGDLVQYAATNVALVNGDSVACWPGFTNLVENSKLVDTGGTVDWWSQGTDGTPQQNSGWCEDSDVQEVVFDANAGDRDFFLKTLSLSPDTTYTFSIYVVDKVGAFSSAIDYVMYVSGDVTSTVKLANDSVVEGFNDVQFTTDATDPASVTVRFGVGCGNILSEDTQITIGVPQLTAHSYRLPPVLTESSSVAVDASEPYVALPALTENFAGQLRWTPSVDDQGTVWLLGNYTDANNAWGILHDGTNIIFRNRVSGSNNDATKALNYSPDTEYLIQWKHSAINGLDIAVDRVSGTNDSTTTSVTNATNTYIGQDGNDASHTIGKIRDLRHIKVAANISAAEWLAL